MPEQILMPELGESVHEGTVSRWLKNVGDIVKEDEPVVEIMTDKVNTELQAPIGGMLVKTTVPEGGLVEVFSEIGLIEPDIEAAKAMLGISGPAEEPAPQAASAPEPGPITPKPVDSQSTKIDLSGPQAELARTAQPAPMNDAQAPAAPEPVDSSDRKWFTPVVRAMAREHGISDAALETIAGTGEGGRVTKKDVEAYLDGGAPVAPASAPAQPTPVQPVAPVAAPAPPAPAPAAAATPAPAPAKPVTPGADQEVVPLAGMRKAIADHMVKSAQVPVVSTLIEVDVTPLVEFRSANKDSFQASHGVKLTYTPFFIKALAETLGNFPMLNASLQNEQIVMNKGVHMGVAVSLGKDGDGGLIVPVIRDCHAKGLVDIARDLETIAARARGNDLGLPDIQGGTFTLTNPGSYGAILGTPMVNAPQAGIAGIYGIQQKPVIMNGMIAIRSVMNIVLTYDHRLVDGLTAGRFLQAVKTKLESMDFFR